jgi:hypothetical protein
MDRPTRMLAMYVNRCNSKWAEACSWDVPHVYSVARFAVEAGAGTAGVYR